MASETGPVFPSEVDKHLPHCTARIGYLTTTVPSNNGENLHLAADQQLLELRNAHWDLVAEANIIGDHKEYSKSPAWRTNISEIRSALLHAAPASEQSPLYEVTQILRSFHPGRALPCTNPTKLASVSSRWMSGNMPTDHHNNHLCSYKSDLYDRKLR